MHPSELWFPLDGSQKTTGRFVDTVIEGKRESGEAFSITRPALEAKASGSQEISFQVVKEFNKKQLIARCPLGWAHYEKLKAAPEAMPAIPTLKDLGIRGTPIEDAALHCGFNNDRITWFKAQGIMTVQQVAELTDMACQNLGRGSVTWRKKAKEFLASGTGMAA